MNLKSLSLSDASAIDRGGMALNTLFRPQAGRAGARLARGARLFSTAVEEKVNGFDITGQALSGRAVYLDAQVCTQRARAPRATPGCACSLWAPLVLTSVDRGFAYRVRRPRRSLIRACLTR